MGGTLTAFAQDSRRGIVGPVVVGQSVDIAADLVGDQRGRGDG